MSRSQYDETQRQHLFCKLAFPPLLDGLNSGRAKKRDREELNSFIRLLFKQRSVQTPPDWNDTFEKSQPFLMNYIVQHQLVITNTHTHSF